MAHARYLARLEQDPQFVDKMRAGLAEINA